MSVGSRIKELRESMNMPRSVLAKKLDVTVGAISNYENEISSPKEPVLFKIFEALDCDANYLFQDAMTGTLMQNRVSLKEYDIIEKYRSLDPYGKEAVDFIMKRELERMEREEMLKSEACKIVRMPFPGNIAAAGISYDTFSMVTDGTIELPDSELTRRADYAIGVSGDSMEPEYFDGDIVLVRKTFDISYNDVGIFQMDNEVYIKQYTKDGLHSFNPLYSDMQGNATCLGKVIGKAEI